MSEVVRIGRSASGTTEPFEAVSARPRRQPRPYISLNGAAVVTIAAIALSIIGILYLIQTSQVAGLGYRLSHLQQRHDELALENAALAYQVARYESLETIDQVAIEQIGMTQLRNYQFIEVRRPAQENLPAPPVESEPPRSRWSRIIAALLGEGHAASSELSETSVQSGGSRP